MAIDQKVASDLQRACVGGSRVKRVRAPRERMRSGSAWMLVLAVRNDR
jgi:hypothetical protein